MDTAAKWWSTAEIDRYVNAWQDRLQEWFEFVWTTSTTPFSAVGITTNSLGQAVPAGTASANIAGIMPNCLRPADFYWINSSNTVDAPFGVRLVGRTKQDLDILLRDWRNCIPLINPLVVYQDTPTNIVLFPAPAVDGTLVAEYPKQLCMVADTDLMEIPAWTKYSCADYVAYRALLRTGPNQDLKRAMMYKAQFARNIMRYRRMWDAYFPYKYTQFKMQQKTDFYLRDILNPLAQTVIPP